jgi:hypothetical protein
VPPRSEKGERGEGLLAGAQGLAPKGVYRCSQMVFFLYIKKLFSDFLEKGPVGVLGLGNPLMFVAVDKRRRRLGDG